MIVAIHPTDHNTGMAWVTLIIPLIVSQNKTTQFMYELPLFLLIKTTYSDAQACSLLH
jgi:hypothetical protein